MTRVYKRALSCILVREDGDKLRQELAKHGIEFIETKVVVDSRKLCQFYVPRNYSEVKHVVDACEQQ